MAKIKTAIKVKDTSQVKVPEKIIDRVIGQERAVAIIKKAAKQKRNVLLIGTPGTGKSMLAQAMSELMPLVELRDFLVYPNDADSNVPRIRVVKAGEGRKILEQERLKVAPGNNFNLIIILILFLSSFFLLSFGRQQWGDIITAALLIGLFVVSGVVALGMQLGRSKIFGESMGPKLLVDNSDKKKSPFVEATGARAGALLGDVKHDPLQCFFTTTSVVAKNGNSFKPKQMHELVDELLTKYPERIERNTEGYEGMILPENEFVYVMGFHEGKTKPVRVLCVNRRHYDGNLHSIRSQGERVLVTPNHKLFVNDNYVEASKLSGNERFKTHTEPIVTRDDLILTFSPQDQKAAFDYYEFLKIKQTMPSAGYKRIAKMLGIKPGQVRWWNNKRVKPNAVNAIEKLEALGLLPFTLDDKRAPIVARVLGTTFGDGGIHSNLNAIFLSSSEEKTLDDYENDLCTIFGEEVREKFDRRKSGVNQTGMLTRNTSRAMIRFFLTLGAPLERKSKEIQIPAWIHQKEETQKEFFGALLGNELCSPKFSPVQKKIQYFGIGLAGEYKLKENRIRILREISNYLQSYGIKTTLNINENQFRENKYIWRLGISTEIENVLKFYELIPIRYSSHKEERLRICIEDTTNRKRVRYTELLQERKNNSHIATVLKASESMLQKMLLKEEAHFSTDIIKFSGTVYNVTTESGNLFANGILASNSGGLGTPAHLRVDAGFIHKASGGVLFIDEVSALSGRGQQELLTAMQEKKYSITGQSELSSGAQVRTEPVPCDFVLVAAGNYKDLQKMHPALRSRIRGYGYEVYMEESIEDNAENEHKVIQFIAQEVNKDGKIPHFDSTAIEEIIQEARKRSGRKNKLTLKLRELGGLIRAAGDLALEDNAPLVTVKHVNKAKTIAQTLEQQMAKQTVEMRKEYRVFTTTGAEVGKVNGLAVMGDSGVVLPIVAEVAPASSREEGKTIATGKLGEIAKEAVENVSAIIKKHIGKDTSSFDIHIQFLQTYEGVEGDSASVSVATAVISALEEAPIRQDIALTGSLSVRGQVLPVGGVTQKVEAAIEAGLKKAVIPYSNKDDVLLSEEQLKKIEIMPVKDIYDVLKVALKEGKKKDALLSKIKKEFA